MMGTPDHYRRLAKKRMFVLPILLAKRRPGLIGIQGSGIFIADTKRANTDVCSFHFKNQDVARDVSKIACGQSLPHA